MGIKTNQGAHIKTLVAIQKNTLRIVTSLFVIIFASSAMAGMARHKKLNFKMHQGNSEVARQTTQIALDLFDGEKVSLQLHHVEVRNSKNFTWHGQAKGFPKGSEAILSVVDGQISGQMVLGSRGIPEAPRVLQIHSQKDGSVELHEIDQSQFPKDHPDENHTSKPAADVSSGVAGSSSTTGTASGDSGATIDILVLYSNQTAAAAGSAIGAQIQQAIDVTNTVFANTGVATRLRLVGGKLANYNESGDFPTDLNWLSSSAEVQNLRNAYGADLISMFIENGQYCGYGWIGPSSSSAYTVVNRGCASGNYTFPHELGHNFGALHDTFVDPSTSPYAYGHGYVNCAESWRTVMAYASQCGGTRLPYFSNPNLTYGVYGSPLGTTASNNVAKVVNDNALTVANYRASINGCIYSLSANSASVGGLAGSGTISVSTSGTACAWGAKSNASWLTIDAGSGTSDNGTLIFSYSDNFSSTRSGAITIGSQTFTLTQASACSFSLSNQSASFTAAGGLGAVSLTASNPACAWTAKSSAAWLTLSSAAASNGSAVINYTVASNSSAARSANLTIAGLSLVVTQEASATPVASLSPSSLNFGTVMLGKTSTMQSSTLTNVGGGSLTISSVVQGGANSADFVRSGSCSVNTVLASGQSCTIQYVFKPSVATLRTANLSVVTSGGARNLTLSGTGKKSGKR